MSDSEELQRGFSESQADPLNIRIKIRQRQYVLDRIQVLKENSSQLIEMSAHQIDAKLSLIDRHYDLFESIQSQIELLDETQLEGDHRNTFEESYFEVRALLVERLSALRINETENALSSTRMASQSTASSHHRINLPKLQLTKFSGLHREWLDFHNMFLVLVHHNTELSDIEKFQYLRSCLTEKAARLIESLEVTGANYQKAMELLTARYDNKRYIFLSHLHHIFEIQHVTKPSVSSLRELVDTINSNLRAMQSLASNVQIADGILLHLVVSKLDLETQTKWEEEIATNWDRNNASASSVKLPAWEDLATFLERRCQTFDFIDGNRSSQKQQQSSSSRSSSSFNTRAPKIHNSHQHTSFVATNPQLAKCLLCSGTHPHNPFQCPKFLGLDPYDRQALARRLKLCFNCLRPNHMTSMCPSSRRCQHCRVSHHTLLHRGVTSTENPLPVPEAPTQSNQPPTISNSSTALKVSQEKNEVILGTALIQLSTIGGITIIARALLDSASQLHFLTERMAQYLRVNRKKQNVEINGIGLNNTKAHHLCSVEIKSLCNDYSSTIEAVIIPSITSYQPNRHFNIDQWGIPKNINLADKTFNEPGAVDILIGASLFYHLLSVGQIIIHENLPVLQKTRLGWIVSGAVSPRLSSFSLSSISSSKLSKSPTPISSSSSFLVQTNNLVASSEHHIDTLLERFWQVEDYRISSKFTLDEEECEQCFANTTRRCPLSNKYIVRLPFKEDPRSLGQSFDIAQKRLVSLEYKINKNSSLFKEYAEFIEEYKQLGHMTLIPQQQINTSLLNYIPHHCVIKNDSSTTRLRVVFDASCRTTNGKSLNDTLRVGPTLQDDIFTILSRFRTYKYVLMADITKMFRQIKVDEEDSKWQCILWRDKLTNSIVTYRLDTVTYGTRCAPYLAQKCLQQAARDESATFPIGSTVTLRDFYVDNLMTGGSTIKEVIEIKNQVIALLKRGGFPLRKFASNHHEIIEDIQPSDREEIVHVDDYEYIKALGLKWSPTDDCFLFRYSQQQNSSKITKRSILSHICSFFDPLGLLNPIIVTCKILMQTLWKLNLHWDESVPQDVHTQWQSLCQQLALIEKIRIPRFVALNTETELHAFSDASTKAYGACVYAVSRRPGFASSHLLCAKSRVAPTKEVSLPRLELCAALLLSELLQPLVELLGPKPENVFCWSDSTITLAWIAGESARWKTFVANRVSKIQLLTSNYTWNHVKSEKNPADMVSRGTNVSGLVENRLWFNGPEFLLEERECWPTREFSTHEELPDQRRQHTVIVSTNSSDIVFDHKFINNYDKFLRVFAYVRRFIAKTKGAVEIETGPISVAEINDTLLFICRRIQKTEFFDDYKNLQLDRPISRTSKLNQLSPFLHNDLLRVGGRIEKSALPFDTKHPILLPSSHRFVYTIINKYHKQHLHAGTQTLQSILRDKFWIIKTEQLMGSLPKDRVEQSFPFEITGVDFCGPLMITQQIRGRKPIKVYISVFICFTTKAVHLELVPDLTTGSFIAALKRFISRRGKCRTIYSDNATNFIGADRELRQLLESFTTQQHIDLVQQSCRQEGIAWKFIPPRSPHFGGLWESAVKQAKYYLRRTIGNNILSQDELHTVCCQAEAIINSRPLTQLSSDPNDLRSLTPAHFLVGRNLTTIAEPSVSHENISPLKRYQVVQWIQQKFWERWHMDYLKELQQRAKWKAAIPNFRQNDLVLLKDENTPPMKWPLGRVMEVIPGQDGHVRVVIVKTAQGIFKRAIAKLCKLPIENEFSSNS